MWLKKQTKKIKELVLFPLTWSLYTPICSAKYIHTPLLNSFTKSPITHPSNHRATLFPKPLSPSAPLSFCDILDLP